MMKHLPLYLTICLFLLPTGCSDTQQNIETTRKPIPVKTVSVLQQDIPKTSTQPATVHAYFQTEIRARVSGYVKEVHVDIGDYVEQGAPLANIDVPEMIKQQEVLSAKISRYQAEEKRANAGVELAKANVQSAQAKLAQAESELSRAEASLTAMEAEFARTQDLVERQSLERRMLDEVLKKRDSELANMQAMKSAILSAQADVTVAKAKLTSADADLLAAKAETTISLKELEELGVMVGYATLKAPFSGIITQRAINPGDLVREANEVGKGTPLYTISQIDNVRIHIPVPEVDAAFINPVDAVTIRFPFFSAEPVLQASVTRIAGALDPSTRTMLVEAELENPDRKLLPGMFGEASITHTTKVATNVLPARAIRFHESGEAYVYVLNQDRTVTVTDIETGFDNGHVIEVVSGIDTGQAVIDAHLKRFVTGQKVSLVEN